jgi:hypothetical protein
LHLPADVRRLYRVQALRDLGSTAGSSWSAGFSAGWPPSWRPGRRRRRRGRQLIDGMEVMTRMHRYYTPEQLEELARRRDELGDEGTAAVRQATAA